MQKDNKKIKVGIAFDEFEVRHGLVYLKKTGRIIGLLEQVKEKDIDNIREESIPSNEITHVLQFFLISTNSEISLPIGYVGTRNADGDLVYNYVVKIIENLKSTEIHWGSSDGASGCKTFIRLMKLKYPNYIHIFDFVHLVKLLRNVLLNKKLKKNNVLFSMTDLIPLYEQEIIKVKFDVLQIPTDRMNLENVIDLFEIIDELKANSSLGIQQFGIYIEHIKILYNLFNENQSMEKKETIIGIIRNYFLTNKNTKEWINSDLYFMLETTLTNIQIIIKKEKLSEISHISTNIVENFFSIIRRKILYPNFYEYAVTYEKAWVELVKFFTKENPVPYRNRILSKTKKYWNQVSSKLILNIILTSFLESYYFFGRLYEFTDGKYSR
jgi:hypothetical protein